jgi:hypothetical protein
MKKSDDDDDDGEDDEERLWTQNEPDYTLLRLLLKLVCTVRHLCQRSPSSP